jgi:TrmH family RNA methyltransferase
MTENNYTVILVHPENPRNIGFCSRAMKCNNVKELRIVSDRWTQMHSGAYITGTSSKPILDTAKFYTSLDTALGDCHSSVAFSRRRYSEADDFCFLPTLSEKLFLEDKTALVFGRESQGLFEEEMEMCTHLCEIPIIDKMSYNLGQACAVALYELCQKGLAHRQISGGNRPTQTEKKAFNKLFLELLDKDYLRKGKKLTKFSKFLNRINPNQSELRLIFGLFRKVAAKPVRKSQ